MIYDAWTEKSYGYQNLVEMVDHEVKSRFLSIGQFGQLRILIWHTDDKDARVPAVIRSRINAPLDINGHRVTSAIVGHALNTNQQSRVRRI